MKVLIISIDRGLLGRGQLGDVLERHRKYGDFCDQLDIIIFSTGNFGINKISDKVIAYPTNSKNKINFYFDALKIGKDLFKENKYDLIVTQEPFLTGLIGYQLKKEFKSKLLVHFHGDFLGNRNWLKESKLNYLFLLILKFVAPRADAIRVMSNEQKEKLIKNGISDKKIRVISTPVDLAKFLNHYELVGLKKEKVVLHVGRDDEVKDYDTLIKAFKIIKQKNPKVIFWQAGANVKINESMVKNDFYGIELKGLVTADNLISLYYASDVLALSSTSESFGKVLVEANACGKPVVSTATTGAKEIIQDGENGFLVPIGDAEKLAEKIIQLLDYPEEARRMGEKGRQIVQERFGDNLIKIIQFWRDIIENKL